MREQAVPAQIALSWLMVQKPWIVPISGTAQMTHMVDNIGAAAIRFTPDEVAERNASVNQARLAGHAARPPCWPYPRGRTTEEIENEVMHYEHPKDGGGFRMMKRIDALLMIAFAVICLLSGAAGAQQRPAKGQGLPAEKKILIVYLSRTNNTKAIADIIHEKVGGKLVALELETPYPADYRTTVQQVVQENETGYLPPLKTKIERMEQYDFVYLGFPTWGMQLPPPVKSFLRQYSLKGKTVIPFNTNGGYGVGSSFDTVKELCPQSKILPGFSTRGGSEIDGHNLVIKDARAEEAGREVASWLTNIGMLK